MSSGKLSPKQYLVLGLLASGSTQVDAARAAKITARTIQLWNKRCPAFSSALEKVQTANIDELEVGDVKTSLTTFRRIATDEDAPASAQVSAAKELWKCTQNQKKKTEVKPSSNVEANPAKITAENFFQRRVVG